MKINTDTATSLGEKLAGLQLTDEEGVLLTSMLSANSNDEVEGFGYTEVEHEYVFRKNVVGALPKSWNIEQGSAAYTEIEMDR